MYICRFLFYSKIILGANLQKDKLKRLKWNVGNAIPVEIPENIEENNTPWKVTLNPFQIRTFIIDLTIKA